MILTNEETSCIYGGASTISGQLLNSITKAFSMIFEFGKVVGSSIKYKVSGRTC